MFPSFRPSASPWPPEYTGWLGNGKVFYLSKRAVYGTAGQNLELVTIGVDGKGRRTLQAAIDAAAMKDGQ